MSLGVRDRGDRRPRPLALAPGTRHPLAAAGRALGASVRAHPQLVVAAATIAVVAAILPLAPQPLSPIPGLVPACVAAVICADLLTVALLVQEFHFGSGSPRLLGVAATYLLAVMVAIPFVVAFPDTLAARSLAGGDPFLALWLRSLWQAGFVLGLMLSLSLPPRAWLWLGRWLPAARPIRLLVTVAAIAALAAAVLTALGLALAATGLPVVSGASYHQFSEAIGAALLLLAVGSLVPLARAYGTATAVERWALVGAYAAAADMTLMVAAQSWSSLGWVASWAIWVAAEAFLMLGLLHQILGRDRRHATGSAAERTEIGRTLAHLERTLGAQPTAEAICSEVGRLRGVDVVALLHFLPDGTGVPLALWPRMTSCLPLQQGRAAPAPFGWYLRERAETGSWVERLDQPWTGNRELEAFRWSLATSGLRAMSCSPVTLADQTAGVLVAAVSEMPAAAGCRRLHDWLPALDDFAAIASGLLAPTLQEQAEATKTRSRIMAVIEQRAFHPVFQPIVELGSGRTIGYEALARFSDGTPPDLSFATASGAGLDVALELVCLQTALGAARTLPPDAWLSLNVSPQLLLEATDELRRLTTGSRRPLIMELTEHVAIADYARVRQAVAELGPDVRLAVDDAGSGFASLRHVLELYPSFVKLDISLVRGIDTDLIRQALVAGLVSFTARTGWQLIAEGVETPGELAELRALQIPLGQGYLLARPAPAPAELMTTAS